MVKLGLLGVLSTSFVVGLSGAMMPGPLLTATVDQTIRRGSRWGVTVVFGHAVAEACIVAAIAFGLRDLLTRDAVAAVVGIGGGLLLFWMGRDIFQRGRAGVELELMAEEGRNEDSPPTEGKANSLLSGVLVSISNPYWLLWWVGVGGGYTILSQKHGMFGLGAFYFGHIGADFAWYGLVILLLTQGRRYVSGEIYSKLLAGFGVFLMGFALYFLYSGVKFAI